MKVIFTVVILSVFGSLLITPTAKGQLNHHLAGIQNLNRDKFKYYFLEVLLSVIFVLLITSPTFAKQPAKISDKLTSCEWHFGGHLGGTIDKIAEERILNKEKWDMIYPETEEAFRLREDDKNYPKAGEWRGEFWGKYILSAIAACRYYHSDELKDRIAGAVKGLLSTQDANGYIGTYAHSDFVEGNSWNVWNRKYTLWGLIESWELLRDQKILDAAIKFTDHLISEVGPGAKDIVKTGNFYGLPSSSILQPIVKLYIATGQKRYLDYAEYILKQWTKTPGGLPDIVNQGLSGTRVDNWLPQVDPNKWAKGYEFTSCVEGLAELYKVTGKKQYLQAAENIHAALVKWERTPVGSVSFDDKYAGATGLINTVSEVCDAVYWNRLSFELFKITGKEKYIDEIERTLYNSLLCAYNPEGSWGLRRLRMSHLHIPAHNHFLPHHQCCTDNLPRALFQAGETALTSRKGNIYLSLFNQGEGEAELPSGRKIKVRLDGDFLDNAGITTLLKMDQPEQFNFIIRVPKWSKHTIVRLNGVPQNGEPVNNWLVLNRKWENGDKVEINFDLGVRWENFDTTKFNASFHNIDFYERKFEEMKFIKGTDEKTNLRYENVKSLSSGDALPQKPAITFFYGPIALARDVRITGSDVFFPVEDPQKDHSVRIRTIPAPSGIWKAFELNLNREQIKFCDFSSAGNTWDNDSQFNTWCILK